MLMKFKFKKISSGLKKSNKQSITGYVLWLHYKHWSSTHKSGKSKQRDHRGSQLKLN